MHRRLLIFDETIQAIKMFFFFNFQRFECKLKKNTIPLRQYFDKVIIKVMKRYIIYNII